MGLAADTDYEVKVTWSDADCVGAQPAISIVRTLSFNPPTGGSVITVTSDTTLDAALSGATPGQTIHLNSGNYGPFAITRSGTERAWLIIEGDQGGPTIVSGVGVTQNVRVTGSYLVIRNLTLGPSDWSGFVVSGGNHHVFIQDNVIQDVSRFCATDPTAHYGDAGIDFGGSNIYILRNSIKSTSLDNPACTPGPTRWDSPGDGIQRGDVASPSTFVYMNNTIVGGFRDGIGGWGDGPGVENVDVVGNTVRGVKDDAIEMDGDNVNVRIWGNTLTVDNGDSAVSNAPVAIGPTYVFRNVVRVATSVSDGLTVFKLGGDGVVPNFYFHNSIDSSSTPVAWDGFSGGIRGIFLNNIMKNSGSAILHAPSNSLFAYNVYFLSNDAELVYDWNGASSYHTLVEFRQATGQEQHGKQQDPLYTDILNHINASSPAFDSGIVIPNFNDAASLWPYNGAAPDRGAYEYQP